MPPSSSWENPSMPNSSHQAPVLPLNTDHDDTESLGTTLRYDSDQDEESFLMFDHIVNGVSAPEVETYCFPGITSDIGVPHSYTPFSSEPRQAMFYAAMAMTDEGRQLLEHLKPDEMIVFDVIQQKPVIEKNFDELSAKEVKQHHDLVLKAMQSELESFRDHDCFKPILRHEAQNILTSRWLFKWKMIDGVRTVKARLCVHGFKDSGLADLQTYASTTTRWGQRLINSIAAQKQWRIITADVSTAFLRGLTFDQLADVTGEPLREVSFVPPKGSEEHFKKLCPQYDQYKHVLRMYKAIFGLADAPRAWRKRLHQILTKLGARALRVDGAIYIWFHDNVLAGITSAHVDDLKITGNDKFLEWVIAAVEQVVGKLKIQRGTFEHCGIIHVQHDDCSVSISQDHYAKNLNPISTTTFDLTKEDTVLAKEFHELYMSLLGGLSWLTQTRSDVAIYICALQRAAKAPQLKHLLRLNKVTKWVKRKPFMIIYRKLVEPLKVIAICDSAFRKEDTSGLAMRGAIIALAEDHSDHPGGQLHMLEFYARKQRRITRSTFAAELHSLIDATEMANLIAFAIAEISSPRPLQASDLVRFEETGTLPVHIEAVVDAKSVYDTLRTDETKLPTETSLIMPLLQLKEMLRCFTIRTLWWVDTRDMVADGLNKGMVSRVALIKLAATGLWTLEYQCLKHNEKIHVPITSGKTETSALYHRLSNQ